MKEGLAGRQLKHISFRYMCNIYIIYAIYMYIYNFRAKNVHIFNFKGTFRPSEKMMYINTEICDQKSVYN